MARKNDSPLDQRWSNAHRYEYSIAKFQTVCRKRRWPQPNPRRSLIATIRKHWEQDKASKGHHQTRKPKAINKAKGEKKTETKNTPAKASPTSAPPKKTKRVCV
jgi:hypothetical protein